MSFTEVASAAIRLARDRFPMYPFMVEVLGEHLDEFKDLPGTANIFYPRGAMPPVGERFVQTDLGKTLQYLCDKEEEAASGGRDAGIDAARRAFYEGDIAAAIVRQQNDEGGLMTREGLSEFRAEIEDPARATFGAYELYGCGPWCQGPMILGAAQMLSGMDLGSMGHSSVDYIHAVVEALKLSAADREAYVGDPAQIDVPLDRLLDTEYSRARRARIDPARAFPGMPPAGHAARRATRWIRNTGLASRPIGGPRPGRGQPVRDVLFLRNRRRGQLVLRHSQQPDDRRCGCPRPRHHHIALGFARAYGRGPSGPRRPRLAAPHVRQPDARG